MISSLIEFGKWLVDNDKDNFGKNLVDSDWILRVRYVDNNFVLDDNIVMKKNFIPNFQDSIFNEELLFPPKPMQNFLIPSTAHLAGFTPFCILIVEDKKDLSKFSKKPKKSVEAFYDYRNAKFKEKSKYFKVLKELFDDFEGNFLKPFENFNNNFSNRHFINESEKMKFLDFINNYSIENVLRYFKEYYEFIDENVEIINDMINTFSDSEEYQNENGRFFLVCEFSNEIDYVNDILFYYSMLIKERNDDYLMDEDSKCSICGNNGIAYPLIPCYGINKKSPNCLSFFHFENKSDLFKLRLCKECNYFLYIGFDRLRNIFNNNDMLIIPKKKNGGDFEEFVIKANADLSDFEKINLFLNDCEGFNFDLALIKQDKALMRVYKYIDNYKAFLVKFEDIYLYQHGKLNYLFNINLANDEIKGSEIYGLFSLEKIFKDFFVNIEDGKYKFLNKNFKYFYKIYSMDLEKIFKDNYDSNLISLFSKYMYSIFSFIYEINFDAINKNMINQLCLNSLIILEKNNKRDEKGNFLFRTGILKRLNYLFMFKREFLGDNMLSNENMVKLEDIFKGSDSEESKITNLLEILDKDPAFKYFLIGQFIRYIDDFKFRSGKNASTFSNFINNANRNNLKKLFVRLILENNEFYIKRLSKKGKMIFNMFLDYDNLFNEKGFVYEDYSLLMFTGYYTPNLLKSEKEKEEDKENEGENDE